MRNAVGSVDSVLVLGGRSEIGAAIAERLVRDGARRVVLAARGATRVEDFGDVASRLHDAGPVELHGVDFDAAEPGRHAEVVARAVELVGDLDVVIAAFGVLGDQGAYEEDPASAARDVGVNFGGLVSASLAVARRLRRQGHGALVVLSSVAGVRVRRGNMVYGAAKAGVDRFAVALGDSLRGSGARVLVVRPGHVFTSMSRHVAPAPFPTTATDVATRVVAALRADRDTVWCPAVLRPLFGVLRLLPRPVWRRLPR
ncbi:SDR family NAD(P)-dependent oxidoreductase [Spiractinospora alimapuensis]|uniref:SDR family NAD(P)-dependent oxidoreductase n=1 Tax=Spiractinospora alimapuensis TaxID=2820884 RepID=UPI001F369216|nr:SDR family NAD(P)-dependent oxidoreductase [Spiractinospora alimapuensis]QVQ54292.1 SDR family NAD(P)-dependent oxidoreductase [Spiractinospora alimapuensis]